MQIDYSGLITLYNSALTSPIEARRHKLRDAYRPGDIFAEDLQCVRDELDEVLARDPQKKQKSGRLEERRPCYCRTLWWSSFSA